MVTIRNLINVRLARIMDVADALIPGRHRKLFKKTLFNELGKKGLEQDLKDLIEHKNKSEQGAG